MLNSRAITDLSPEAAAVCRQHVRLCHEAGIEIIVTSTYRDYESQTSLYAIGRTVDPDKPTITNAKAGQSWHNFKAAWDVVPIIQGKAVWNEHDPAWRQVVALGKAAGAEAGAEWKSFRDLPHFQFLPRGLTLAQARVRFDAKGSVFV